MPFDAISADRQLSQEPLWRELYGGTSQRMTGAMDDLWVDMKLAKMMLGAHFSQVDTVHVLYIYIYKYACKCVSACVHVHVCFCSLYIQSLYIQQ
jgi:hypothetical protein